MLDEHLLRKSMARLNEANFFEPVNERNTIIHTDPKTGIADIDIRRHGAQDAAPGICRDRLGRPASPGRWKPPSVRACRPGDRGCWKRPPIRSRSACSLSSIRFFRSPGTSEDSLHPHRRPQPALYAGQGWKSGFMIIPQLGWEYMVLGYGVSQLGASLASGYCKAIVAWSRSWLSLWTLPAAEPRCSANRPRRAIHRRSRLPRACVSPGHGGTLDRFGHWRFRRDGWLASVDQPQNQRKNHADQQARHQREVEYRVLAPDDDIARQTPQPDGKLFAERNEHARAPPPAVPEQSACVPSSYASHLNAGVGDSRVPTLDVRCAKVNVRPEVMI